MKKYCHCALEKYNSPESPPISSESLWWQRLGRTFLDFVWILCKWKVLLQTYRHNYTTQRYVITMGK